MPFSSDQNFGTMPSKQGVWFFVTSWCESVRYVHPTELAMELPGLFDYMVGQLEAAPTTGRLHWQWVCHIDQSKRQNKKTMVWMKEHVFTDGEHFEFRKREEALEYVQKEFTSEGERFEWGKLPFEPNSSVSWQNELELFQRQAYKEMNAKVFILHHKNFFSAVNLLQRPYMGMKEVNVFWGEAGSGKSRAIWDAEDPENTGKLYVISDPKWWDGYTGQEAVFFDEFTGQWPIEYWLRVCDRYPMSVPIKGGMVPLMAKRIYFASNKNWREWYKEGTITVEQMVGLERRITREKEFVISN